MIYFLGLYLKKTIETLFSYTYLSKKEDFPGTKYYLNINQKTIKTNIENKYKLLLF